MAPPGGSFAEAQLKIHHTPLPRPQSRTFGSVQAQKANLAYAEALLGLHRKNARDRCRSMEFHANSWALQKIPQTALFVAANQMTAVFMVQDTAMKRASVNQKMINRLSPLFRCSL